MNIFFHTELYQKKIKLASFLSILLFAFLFSGIVAANPDALSVIIESPLDNENITGATAYAFNADTNETANNLTWQYYSGGWNDIAINTTSGTNFTRTVDLNSTLIPDGNYSVRAIADNGGLNESTSSNSEFVTFDFTAPTITLGAPYADGNITSNSTPIFTFNVTDQVINGVYSFFSCELFMNGTGYGTNTTVGNNTDTQLQANGTVPNGGYEVAINCTDYAGNEGASASRYITIDASAIQMAISIPADNKKNRQHSRDIQLHPN